MTRSAQLSDYSLGVDDAERVRLLAQCALHRSEAVDLLDHIDLRPRLRVCSISAAARSACSDLLAERVGPTGRVTGVDREAGGSSTSPRRSWPNGGCGLRISSSPMSPTPGCPTPRSTWFTSGWCW